MLIAGNVGVGKSTLFERICHHRKIRWEKIPGTSLQVPVGRQKGGRFSGGGRTLLDAPGVYSIFGHNEDDAAYRHLLLSGRAETILVLLDAKNLRRSLALALQLAEFGRPMCFLLNMMDEAENRGIEISIHALRARLGVGVRWAVLVEDQGLEDLDDLFSRVGEPTVEVRFPGPIEQMLEQVEPLLSGTEVPARALGLLLLSGVEDSRQHVEQLFGRAMLERVDGVIEEARQEIHLPPDVALAESYATAAEPVANDVQRLHRSSPPFITLLGRWAQRLSTGIPMALAIMVAMYYWVGAFGATFVVDLLNNKLFSGWLTPLLQDATRWIPWPFVRGALVDDDFGVLTTGLFLACGIVLPVLFCFYLFFGLLEESGYLPRFSVLLNRLLRRIGLNGKGLIPLVMGFSCITMALLTTRILDTRKERIIASLLLILAVPCAPLLGVTMVILAPMPWYTTAVFFGFIGLQVLLAGWLASKVLPGRRTDLILELPPMRIPRLRTVLHKTWRRTYYFMKEAIPVFLVASFALFLFNHLGGLGYLEEATRPVVGGWLGLPEQSVRVFIKTIIRRESGATELDLLRAHFSNLQLVITLLVMTLLIPCVNSVIVLFKERRLGTSLAILGTVFTYSLFVGGLANHVCRALGITFGHGAN